MITELRLRNFKCFSNLQLPLAPLTLLAGLNGMGKSSVIQSLLLLRQSWEADDLHNGRLLLSGELTDLGTGVDILFEKANEDSIGIGLSAEMGESRTIVEADFYYEYKRESDSLLSQNTPEMHSKQLDLMGEVSGAKLSLFGSEFHYIFAERFGPRKMLPLSETHAREKKIGVRGEFVLQFLISHGKSIAISKNDPRYVGEKLEDENDPSSLLINQVDAWLQEISPGSHLAIDPIRRADSALGGFEFDQPKDVRTRAFRATNVGFGLSYVLPVIVALLAAPSGAIVLLENPEAHMHPKGQTRLGQLAARAAAAGVQVIVETHSDHFMDGARIDIRNGILEKAKAVFHYFERHGVQASALTPRIDDEGRMDSWPTGFFDQHEENLTQLLAPKKRAG